MTASEHHGETCVIQAEAPLTELFDYADEFRSMTQGQGSFTMEFLAYRQAPRKVQKQVVTESQCK